MALTLLVADLAWVVFSVIVGFPNRLEVVFQTLVAGLTFALVFVIQHTQARQQAATQRKLAEILRTLPGADNALLTLEHASEHELQAATDSHRAVRREALYEAAEPNPEA